MGIGIRRHIGKLYVIIILCNFLVRRCIFGFENANRLLRFVDKRSVVPIIRRFGGSIGKNCDLDSPLIFHNCQSYGNLIVGSDCHIGKDVFLDLRAPIVLENDVTVSMRASIITHSDFGKRWYRKYGYSPESARVILKKGCYVGSRALILQGITIGECAIVGAGAVVNKNVPSLSIVAGVPAKVIGYMCKCGNRLAFARGKAFCGKCLRSYVKKKEEIIELSYRCTLPLS